MEGSDFADDTAGELKPPLFRVCGDIFSLFAHRK